VRAIILAVVALSVCTASLARADGSAAAGEGLFKHKCGSCHSVEAGKNRVGPSLASVVGRKAASIETYSYSEPMRNSGLTWDPVTLDTYLTNPRAKVPGTKMTFVGLPQASDCADIIAYLNTLK
jgi:cytochrome c